MANTDNLKEEVNIITKTDVYEKIILMLIEFENFLSQRKNNKNYIEFKGYKSLEEKLKYVLRNHNVLSNKPKYDEFFNEPNYLNDKSYFEVLDNTIKIYNEIDNFILVPTFEILEYVKQSYSETHKEVLNTLPKVIFDNINWDKVVEEMTSEFGCNDYLGEAYYIIEQ